MLAAQALVLTVLAVAIVAILICYIFKHPIKLGYKKIAARLEHEQRVSDTLQQSKEQFELLREKSLTEARKEVEEMSLQIGQKGDSSCP